MSHSASSVVLRSAAFCAFTLVAACGADQADGSSVPGPQDGAGAHAATTTTDAGGAGGAGGSGGSTTTGAGGIGGSTVTGSGGGGGMGGSSSSAGGSGGGLGGAGNGGFGGASTSTSSTSTSTELQTCAADSSVAEQIPLDMYIMLDQSGSMKGTKWAQVTGALKTFVAQDDAKGIGVGIQYFALADSCNVNAYATPEVPISPLPGAAQAIINSIDAHSPSGGTPTLPALKGALQHAASHATANPTHAVIVVLATDGAPSGCSSSINNVSQAAAAGLGGTPSVATYVIGVGNVTGLNTVAQAGGTGTAFIVSGQDVDQQFLDAMNDIRGKALGCTYLIPEPKPGELLDFGKINVEYTPGDLSPKQLFNKVDGEASCPPNGDAWYYNDNLNPSTINLCPSTCAKVSSDAAGQISVAVGCQTIHD